VASGGEPFTIPFPTPPPAERRGEHWWVEAGGHEVRLSNLGKPYWPPDAGGFTKGDLLAYYFNAGRRCCRTSRAARSPSSACPTASPPGRMSTSRVSRSG
jgi:hypothetical protein